MLRPLVAFLFACLCCTAHAQTILCFGDSLTAGQGAPPGQAYPDDLRADLAQAGYSTIVINQGINGNTTRDALARLPAALAVHPAIVILEFGANDGFYKAPLSEIEQNLRTLIESLQRAHIQVLLAGIDVPATLPFTPPPQLTSPYMRSVYALYPALAAQYHLPVVPSLLQGVYGILGLMSPDYLHPNAAGYAKVARTVLPLLEPMLKHQPTR